MIPFKRGQCLRIPSKPLTNVTYIAADFAKRKSIILTKIILISKAEKITETRMHSSRMPTVRSSSRLLGGSASVHAGIHPPTPGPGPPPPRPGPGDSGQTPQPPRWVWAWRPPPCEQNDRHV